jgi:peptide/nickel transport system substrate-binding protein
MRHRVLLAGSILSVAALVGSSCGGSNDSAKKNENEKVQELNVADVDGLTRGGTLTFGLEAETTGGFCLPSAQLAAGGIMVMNAIYDPLAAYDENFHAKPYLAESITPNADSTQFTIKLRSGVKFHDGTDVDADAVALNIRNWYGDPETVAKTGVRPVLLALVFADIAGVTVNDPLTLTVNLKKSWTHWVEFLAQGRFGIMAKAQLMGGEKNCADHLIGSGPFMLKSPSDWVRNQQMTLAKNPSYWRKGTDGQALPYLDSVVFKPIEGAEPRLQAIEAGTINALHTGNATSIRTIASNPNMTLVKEADGHKEVAYGLINVAKPPLDDETIRRAMGQAIDRNVLNDISNEGSFKIADQPFDTKTLGYVEGLKLGDHDPAAAEKVLKGKNLSITINYATDNSTKLMAEEIKRELGEVGVNVDIQSMDQSTLIQKALSGEFNINLWRNHPGGDPDTQYVWWHSGMPTNFQKLNDPVIDKALDEARASTDDAKRKELYQSISKQFVDKAYTMWTWYSEWAYGAKKDVKQLGYYTLPDGTKGTGMNWGWTFLAETWIKK